MLIVRVIVDSAADLIVDVLARLIARSETNCVLFLSFIPTISAATSMKVFSLTSKQ